MAQDLQATGSDGEEPTIQHIDLIHLIHTDIGWSDHPFVARELFRRFLDIAIDGAMSTREKPEEERFSWTVEATITLDDWWQAATPARREEFLEAVRSGQLEVTALALNQAPVMNREQWHEMLHWIPEDLWRKVHPEVAIQNDVNGFPRAGAKGLLDRGTHYLVTGINEYNGGAPFKTPSAFWWRMPGGRRMFVWLGLSYWAGYDFFEEKGWRRAIVSAADTRYRLPRAGDFLRSDEQSVRNAHRHLVQKIRELEGAGYSYPTLVLSITNQWRIDNDPPFLPLADFVAAWKRLDLKPTLRLTTASVALKSLEKQIGDRIPVYEGEWTDWWTNGVAAAPRAVSASRFAKRAITAAQSPVWGEWDANSRETARQILRELCLFDEHTWGSTLGSEFPDGLDSLGTFYEKAGLAYRSMARAEWLLSQRMLTRLSREGEGLYLANSTSLPISGWIEILQEIPAAADEKTEVQENAHTTMYTQALTHPRLKRAIRELETWKNEPRARFTLKIDRLSSEAPEIFYVAFPLPCEGTLPRASNGGLPFVPFNDQLPGTCRDYFAIDGWVHYKTSEGSWLWVSRDAPLVTFGSSQALVRREDPPGEMHRVLAMIFNNFWKVNFPLNNHGAMEFQFDLTWKSDMNGSVRTQDLADSLLAEPQVLINPPAKEDPIIVERLYRP